MLPKKPSARRPSHEPAPMIQGMLAASAARPGALLALRSTGAPSMYSTVSCVTSSLTMATCIHLSAMISPDQLVLAPRVPETSGTTSHWTSRRLDSANSSGGDSGSPSEKPARSPRLPSRVMTFIHACFCAVQSLSILRKASTV